MLVNNLDRVSDAHSFFNYPLTQHPTDPVFTTKENEWKEKIHSHAANGALYFQSAFFDSLKKSDKIYIAHVTKNLEEIKQTSAVYPSAGCLVGSVYCVPIAQEDSRFRVHNLGRYVYEKELKFSSSQQPSIIVLEIDTTNQLRNLVGIDYLKLGNLHLSLYEELKYLLSEDETDLLEKVINQKIKQSSVFIDYATSVYFCNGKMDSEYFFRLLQEVIHNIPILGYIYFEVISEYLMLFSDNNQTKIFAEKGEFNNFLYKDLLYDLLPQLKSGFNLSKFDISIQKIADYISEKKLITNFDLNGFKEYIAERIIFLFSSRMMNLDVNCNWKKFLWDFDSIKEVAGPLIGHMVHRELRSFGRYPDFYFYYDQLKALHVWNYWNQSNIIVPFNGCFPKGEVGINPAFPLLRYKVYSTNLKKENDFLFLDLAENLDVKIIPRLIDLRFTMLRNNAV